MNASCVRLPFRWLLSGVLLLTVAVGVLAQDAIDEELFATFYFSDGTHFEFPAAWDGELIDGVATVFNDDYYIALLNFDVLRRYGVTPATPLSEVLQTRFDFAYLDIASIPFDEDAITEVDIAGRPTLRFAFDDAYGGGLIYAVRFDDGTAGLVHSYGHPETPPDDDLTQTLVRSFETGSIADMIASATGGTVLAETAQFTNGVAFAYPDTWLLEMTPQGAQLFLNEHSVTLAGPAQLQAAGIDISAALEDALPALYATLTDTTIQPFDPDAIRRFDLNGRNVLRYDFFPDIATFVSIFMLPLDDDRYGAMIAETSSGLPPQRVLLAIADSFGTGRPSRPPVEVASEEATPAITEAATSEATVEIIIEAEVTPTVTASATATPSPEPTATATLPPSPEPTATATAQPTATGEPTATATRDLRDILAPNIDDLGAEDEALDGLLE